VRVYELALDLGVTSRDLLQYLRAHNQPALSAATKLRKEQVELARSVDPGEIRGQAVPQAMAEQGTHVVWEEFEDWPRRAEPPEMLTTREAARLVGVSPATVRQWVRRGHLQPVLRVEGAHRFRTQDVRDVAAARLAATNSIHGTSGAHVRRLPARVDIDAVLSTKEAAAIVGVARSTVRSWLSRGHIQARGQRDRETLVRLGDVLSCARSSSHRSQRNNSMP
jgi:excisionase family DNA binding protein